MTQEIPLSLSELMLLVDAMARAEDKAKQADEDAKIAAEAFRRLQEDAVPCALWEYGLQQLKLDDDSTLKLTFTVQGHIDREGEKARAATAWLEENGFGGLVRNTATIDLGKGSEGLAQELSEWATERGLQVVFRAGVHPQSLYAFLKEQLSQDAPLELFNVRPTFKAVRKHTPIRINRKDDHDRK